MTAGRGSLGRSRLLTGPTRTEVLDVATAGREGRGTGLGRAGLGDDGAAATKRDRLQPHLKTYWRIPPKASTAFVVRMEDVLEVYSRPYHPRHPVICMDETDQPLIRAIPEPLPLKPGKPELIEPEYVRNGVAWVLLDVEPLVGRSRV